MAHIDRAQETIRKYPESPSAQHFKELIQALSSGATYPLGRLFQMPYSDFQIAVGILQEWRTQQYVRRPELAGSTM